MKKIKEKIDTTQQTDEEISNNQMTSLFLELSQTSYWKAILKFIAEEDILALGALTTLDPFKEPTTSARTQGFRNGLYHLKNKVDAIVLSRKKSEGKDNTDNG